MTDRKTKPSGAEVASYLARIDSPARRQDCEALADLLGRATGEPPRMWGTAIVGFGVRHYRYESGREGDICRVGFSSRKADISLYGLGGVPGGDALLARLGTHKRGKDCLYVRKLSDIDPTVLEQLVARAANAT